VRRRLISLATALGAALALLVATPGLGSIASAHQSSAPVPSPGAMPSSVPAKNTPSVDDGQVSAIAQVGNTMLIGGTFTSVNSAPHTYLAAFDATTYALVSTFTSAPNGVVNAVIPGPLANTAYIAGSFTQVGSAGAQFIALINVTTGNLVSGFTAPSFNSGTVNDIALSGQRLLAAGSFTKADNITHGGLVAMNAGTGALDPFMGVALTGHHNNDVGGARGAVGGEAIDITPDGSRMVVIGDFQNADGMLRNQLAMIDLTGTNAQVMQNWATTLYAPTCKYTAFDVTVRDVSFSPDGSYFVVTSTGGAAGTTLCDSAVRWETGASGTNLAPTWVDPTGRDTLWGVTVTSSAVYVGGHNRWANNPLGLDTQRQGAVPRAGLMALDPLNGRPLTWNPGRVPLGTSVYALLSTSTGLWIGSDTRWVGNYKYLRPRIAFFPYAGGYTEASTRIGTLPGTVFRAGTKVASPSSVLYRVNAGGPAIQSADNGPDWQADTSASPSRYRNSGSSAAAYNAVNYVNASVPANTPSLLFDSERWDLPATPEMDWKFPVAAGVPVQVRLYLSNRCSCTAGVGQRVFNVSVNGQPWLYHEDAIADVGDQTGEMKSITLTVPSTGLVDIQFTHVTQNPNLNGIEIVNTSGPVATTGGADTASTAFFDGANASNVSAVNGGGITWSQVRGAFMVGTKVFYGGADNYLHSVTYDGSTFGTPVTIEPYHDPLWDTVRTGDKDTTFDGWHPDLYDLMPNVTGMTYYAGRLYYMLYNDPNLYSAWFSPDSGIVDEVSSTTPSSVSFANADGMFVANGTLYYATGNDGNLNAVSFGTSGVTGSSTRVSGPLIDGVDWHNRALFLESSTSRP